MYRYVWKKITIFLTIRTINKGSNINVIIAFAFITKIYTNKRNKVAIVDYIGCTALSPKTVAPSFDYEAFCRGKL